MILSINGFGGNIENDESIYKFAGDRSLATVSIRILLANIIFIFPDDERRKAIHTIA